MPRRRSEYEAAALKLLNEDTSLTFEEIAGRVGCSRENVKRISVKYGLKRLRGKRQDQGQRTVTAFEVLRHRPDLSAADLARVMGVSRQRAYVWKHDADVQPVPQNHLEAVLQALRDPRLSEKKRSELQDEARQLLISQ